ncbi:NAD(P)H-dependent oxidoreductase [Persicobacter diffluens]|uniref:NAD(P)H dehydrogenase (Quinone) n=1 Tax=Persicobacter diffluens TaxID=981 RepID=A0AAN4VX43_9BACT|nr:NAD(P)H dehydrogenase (quinone) [Persicobacter diffluens]
MKTVLVINGHEPYAFAAGQFNDGLFDVAVETLSKEFKVLTTVMKEGYQVEEEHEKFRLADVVIFQFPIYWFSTPGLMKKYFDEVYAYGVFFGMGGENPEVESKYGFDNGLMNGKPYMLSATMNAPMDAFNTADGFFDGKSMDESLLYHIHKTHQFCGMKALPSFGAHNVIKGPQFEADAQKWRLHLENEVVRLFTIA